MTDYEFYKSRVEAAIEADRQYRAEKGYAFIERDFASHNYRDMFEAALTIETREDAQRFLRGNIQHLTPTWESVQYTPEQGALINLGYMAGYYSNEVRQKIEQLFGAVHPIFGSSTPTTEEAFALGQGV